MMSKRCGLLDSLTKKIAYFSHIIPRAQDGIGYSLAGPLLAAESGGLDRQISRYDQQ